MFTKSQLVAAAVLVASASSVMAFPVIADAAELEARSYTDDAIAELKRRAITEYLEEMDARALSEEGTNKTPSRHTVKVTHDTHQRKLDHKKQQSKSHGVASHSTKERKEKHGYQHSHVAHGKGKTPKEHSSTLPSGHTHPKSRVAVGSENQAAHSAKTGIKHDKRSFLEYLGDLAARSPTATTTSSTHSTEHEGPANHEHKRKGSNRTGIAHYSHSNNSPSSRNHRQSGRPSYPHEGQRHSGKSDGYNNKHAGTKSAHGTQVHDKEKRELDELVEIIARELELYELD